MESLSRSPEGLRLHVAGALRNAGFKMGSVRQHDIYERIWIVRITSGKNLRKQAKEATKAIRHGFKYSGVAIEKGSLILSLEGRRGLAIFILSEKA